MRALALVFLVCVALVGPRGALAQAEPVLRPGDVISLTLPGEGALTGDFQIDREGRVALPEVGPVVVAGLTVEQALNAIRAPLATAFQDLSRLRVTLKERRLPITVLGRVSKPGRVELQEDATIQVAIDAAGGLAEGADLARVQLQRQGQTIEFGFDEYLRTGDVALLPALEPLDLLFVPEATAVVRVVGAVSDPGAIEWSRDLSLLDVIAQAGGTTPEADLRRVRVQPPGRADADTFDLLTFLERGGDFDRLPPIRAGSTILVPTIVPGTEWLRQSADQTIFVIGAVGSPGRYAFEAGRSLLDVLALVGGPRDAADLENVYIVQATPAGPQVSRIDLALFFRTGDATLLPDLDPGNLVYVPTKDRQWLQEPKESTVRLLGAVRNPGRYRFDDTMTILDLLAEAGGVTSDAWQEKIVVVNLSCCSDQARTFDLVAFAKTGDFSTLPLVRAGDTVYVPYSSQSNWAIFMAGVRDMVQVTSLVALIAVLL